MILLKRFLSTLCMSVCILGMGVFAWLLLGGSENQLLSSELESVTPKTIKTDTGRHSCNFLLSDSLNQQGVTGSPWREPALLKREAPEALRGQTGHRPHSRPFPWYKRLMWSPRAPARSPGCCKSRGVTVAGSSPDPGDLPGRPSSRTFFERAGCWKLASPV